MCHRYDKAQSVLTAGGAEEPVLALCSFRLYQKFILFRTLLTHFRSNTNIKAKAICIYQLQSRSLATLLRHPGLHLPREFKGYSNNH